MNHEYFTHSITKTRPKIQDKAWQVSYHKGRAAIYLKKKKGMECSDASELIPASSQR
jgi:hypothetical protein